MIRHTSPTLQLPQDPLAQKQHFQCVSHLQQLIEKNGGAISFATFMEQALYAPEVGYYTNPTISLGANGDFTTASEISPLYAEAFATSILPLMQHLSHPTILELGPGSGTFAAHLLLTLERLNALPQCYFLLDISPMLQQRQRTTLTTLCPHLMDRVAWVTDFPSTPFAGVILGHEVIDALPVHLFQYEHPHFYEQQVSWHKGEFLWYKHPLNNNSLIEAIKQIKPFLPEGLPYTSEVNLNSYNLLQQCAQSLQEGMMVLVDYGFPAREYYHPQRHQGTLMCHYQHHNHSNPLILCGLQDITAHVDFTALTTIAIQLGLNLGGYTQQSSFLLDCGILNLAEQKMQQDNQAHLTISQNLKKLLMPHEMGELFKVIAFTKNYDRPLTGFTQTKPL